MEKRTGKNKVDIKQYVYDYGIEKASELLNIDQTKIEEELGLSKPSYTNYYYNTVIDKPLCKDSDYIMQVIANNYDKLYNDCKKYCCNDIVYMSQDLDDMFHNTIIKTIEKGADNNEDTILDSFIINFKTILKYTKLQAYIMKGKINPLEVKNEDNEYIIPAELYNNAYTEETD